MLMKENIAQRWRTEWNERLELARLGREFAKVLGFLDEVPAKRDALVAQGTLSLKGVNEAVQTHCAANVVPALRRAVWEAEKTVNDIATRRAKLGHIEIDKSDVAGALLRQEMRNASLHHEPRRTLRGNSIQQTVPASRIRGTSNLIGFR